MTDPRLFSTSWPPALARLPAMGAWVLDASCGDLGLDAADVFTQWTGRAATS